MDRLIFQWLALLLPLCLASVKPRRRADASEPATEWFVLQRPASSPGARLGAVEEVGIAALRRRGAVGAGQLEWELRFFGEDTRVSHVERGGEGAARLSWREWRPRSGRTLSAELGPTGISLVESGQRQSLRASLPAPRDARFPIAVLEAARSGTLGADRIAWLDPLARAIERLSVRIDFSPEPQPDSSGEDVLERRVRLERDDGTTAAEWTFRGTQLWSARWQSGGLQARRVSAQEWEARVGRCGRLAGEPAAGR
ncbi:MAG: hypothetical protein FJ294_04435 [Planctomycetes bacterium]|nr:hypothetical protein [Planctomycetota bacterium]